MIHLQIDLVRVWDVLDPPEKQAAGPKYLAGPSVTFMLTMFGGEVRETGVVPRESLCRRWNSVPAELLRELEFESAAADFAFDAIVIAPPDHDGVLAGFKRVSRHCNLGHTIHLIAGYRQIGFGHT